MPSSPGAPAAVSPSARDRSRSASLHNSSHFVQNVWPSRSPAQAADELEGSSLASERLLAMLLHSLPPSGSPFDELAAHVAERVPLTPCRPPPPLHGLASARAPNCR